MKLLRCLARLAIAALLLTLAGDAQEMPAASAPQVCATCVRKDLEVLAGPELHGRGSGTADELHAAEFIATQLKDYGLAPAAGAGAYIQTADVKQGNGRTTHTWNVLAKIEGTTQKEQIILLSAHLDHLGILYHRIYPGADDDASGTAAVMELARALAKEGAPKRTLVFAFWGSEEKGLVGARYFLKTPTFDLHHVIANLEFEMIGRPDPKLNPDQLWLSGWERSNLGPELAQHGARLVADPHPEQGFFERSDNFALAEDGIVAQTISSYGLHKDYHRPTDTLDKIDWQHLDDAIGSMMAPLSWLANSDFVPKWNAGGKP